MITSPLDAQKLLDDLDQQSQWALMHGARELSAGSLASDLDIIVDREPLSVIRGVATSARWRDSHPVVLWHYDPWSWTTIWMNALSLQVVQLDLTYDPKGRNKYGLKTDVALLAAHDSNKWPTISSVDELLYLISKRLYKKQWARAAELRDSIEDEGVITSRASQVLSRAREGDVLRYIRQNRRPIRKPSLLRDVVRLSERIRVPAGTWVTLMSYSGHERARAMDVLSAAFSSKLPNYLDIRNNHLVALRAQEARLRPGFVMSAGTSCPRGADVSIPLERHHQTGSMNDEFPGLAAAVVRAAGDVCSERIDQLTHKS